KRLTPKTMNVINRMNNDKIFLIVFRFSFSVLFKNWSLQVSLTGRFYSMVPEFGIQVLKQK
ncbi:MAG: hypothetical protein ACOCZL_00495, partial [Bacteroidota bacterium]